KANSTPATPAIPSLLPAVIRRNDRHHRREFPSLKCLLLIALLDYRGPEAGDRARSHPRTVGVEIRIRCEFDDVGSQLRTFVSVGIGRPARICHVPSRNVDRTNEVLV